MKYKLLLPAILLILITINSNAQVAPGGVSTDLNYWLKADAGITTFNATIGGLTVQRVSQWDNQTNGSANNISGVEDFRRPVFIENGLNFNPAINFDGNNDFLRTDNGWDSHSVIIVFNPAQTLNTNTGVELILVYDVPNNATVDSGIGIGDLGAVSGAYAACSDSYFFNSGDRNIAGTGSAPEFIGCSGDATTTSTDDAVLAVIRPNTPETLPEHKLFGEDQTTTVVNPNEYGVHSDRPFTIGQRHGGGFFYEGDVLEAISYSSRVNNTDILKIESYLAIKYGLTLSQAVPQDYINSLGTTVYDSDGALTNFGFNIAGIGRDDASGLNQKQSISTTTNSVHTSSSGLVTLGLGSIADTNIENANSFSVDQSFLLWGNNGLSTSIGTTVPANCGTLNRMERIWAVQETGTVGIVQLRIPQTAFGLNSPTLLVSSDPTFNSNDTLITLVDDGAGNYTATLDFQSNNYFTFGELNNTDITQFTGGAWTNGIPTATSIARVDEDYNTTANGNIDACSCEVVAGSTLTVDAGGYLNIVDDITVNAGATLTVSHTGNVVQTNNSATVTNNGSIQVKITTPNLASRDFMVLGSPMTLEDTDIWKQGGAGAFLVLNHIAPDFCPNQEVTMEQPGAENFADDNYDNWLPYNSIINPGEGYIVRPQAGFGEPGGVFNYTYADGSLNNGVVNFAVVFNTTCPMTDDKNASPNIVANPYASAISADAFIMANDMVDEIFLWEHLTPPSPDIPGAGSLNYNMEDISMYNLGGGNPAGNPEVPSTTPNGIISTGQGFAFKANAGGTAVFNNSMRLTSGNNTLRTPGTIERLRLSVASETYNLQNNTLISFTENATDNIDPGYDSRRIATVIGLYSHLNDGTEEFGIQTRGAFQTSMTIPIGFSSQVSEESTYKISMIEKTGEQIEQTSVYLVDNVTGIVHDLTEDSYEFTSNKGVFGSRFTLKFENEETLGQGDNLENYFSLYPNPTNDLVYLKVLNNTEVLHINVFDLQGRKMIVPAINENNVYSIDVSNISSAIYFVEVVSNRGSSMKQIVKK